MNSDTALIGNMQTDGSDLFRPSHPLLQHLQGLHHSPQDVSPMTPRLSNLINDRNMQMKTKQGGQEQNGLKIRARVGNRTGRCHFFYRRQCI